MYLIRFPEGIHKWMGWCRHPPVVRTGGIVLPAPGSSAHSPGPDGGGAGPGRIGAGFRLVAGSAKTLIREKRLLWFPLLAGLVLLFLFTAMFLIHVYASYPYEAIPYPAYLALILACEAVTVFCLQYLLAGLILSIRGAGTGGTPTLREAFSRANLHLRSLACLSLGMALAATGLYLLLSRYSDSLYMAVSAALMQFPFQYIFLPEANGTGPITGGYHVSYAATFTASIMIINIVLFILTLYLVPALVLGRKTLRESARESFSLMKKTWGELLACILILGGILLGVSLTSLVFSAARGVILPDGPFYLFFWYQGGWMAGAAVYLAVWLTVVLIGSAIAAIAANTLYTYARTGSIPELPGRRTRSGESG